MGALDVFSQKGFSRTSLNDIAKRIGMTRGAIYWHFKDKQELLVELMEAMHEREDRLLAQKVAEVNSLDDMRHQFMARVEILESDAIHRKFVTFMSLQVEWATEKQMAELVRGGAMRKAPFRMVHQHLAMLQEKGEIRPEVNVAAWTDIMIGLFTGMVRTTLGGLAQIPLAESMDEALQAVIASIHA